jgi:hypothetical protein
MHPRASIVASNIVRFVGGLLLVAMSGCGASLTASTDDDAGAAGSMSTGSGGNGTGGSSTGGNGGSSGSGGSSTGGSAIGGSGGSTAGGGGTGGTNGHPDAAVDCTAGTVTFHMTEAAGTDYCVGVQCTNVWVSVKTMDGKTMSLSGGCLTSCDVCLPIACGAGACIAPQHMKPEGQTLTWDGTYQVQSTCGAGLTCQNKQCAAPGKYIATMCANRSTSDAGINGFCMADQTPTCVEVPFEYPSATTVEGVVGK